MAANHRLYVELAAGVGGFARDMTRAGGTVRGVGDQADRTGKSLARLKSGGLLAVATGIALVGRETLKLDTAMRNVQSITKQSDASLQATSQQLVNLSKVVPQSASTLAEGLYDIASSGFAGADGMKVLNAAATAASAGMTDTATSAKAIAAVLNAYKLDASEAADASDILFQTVNLGVTSFEVLARNVGDYIGQAQALGVQFAETGSAIATLTLNGVAATEAGTLLGSTLNQLIKPGEGMAKVLDKAGYASGTAAIEALGLRGTLMMLREQSGGTAEGLAQVFTDTTALRSALALTSNEGTKYAEVASVIEDRAARAGAAQAALKEQSKAAAFQIGVLRNQAMAAGVEVGNLVLPAVVDGLAMLGDVGEDAGEVLRALGDILGPTFANLAEIGADLWDIFLNVADALGPVAQGLGMLAGGAVVGTLQVLTSVLSGLTGVLADSEVAATLLATALLVYLIPSVLTAAGALYGQFALAVYRTTLGLAALRGGALLTGASMTALLGPIGLVLAAAAAMTLGVEYLAGKMAGAPPSVDKFTLSLLEFSRTGRMAGELAQVLGNDLSDLSRTIEVANQNQWNPFDGEGMYEVKRARGEIESLDQALAGLVQSGNGEAAAEAFARIKEKAGDLSDEELAETFSAYTGALDSAAVSAELAAGATGEVADAQGAAAAETKSHTEALNEQADALKALYDPMFAMQKAVNDHKEAQEAAAAAVKEHGRESKQAKDAQFELLEATVGLSVASDQLMAAVGEGTVSLAASRDQLARWVQQGLISKEQAEQLGVRLGDLAKRAGELSDTPAEVTVTDKGTTKPVLTALQRAKEALEDLNGRNAVVTTTYRTIGSPGSAPITRTVGVGGGLQKADGGYVSGPGTATSDSIPAMLSNGEFVMRAAAVRKIGVENLYRMNRLASGGLVGAVQGFARGGLVSPVAGTTLAAAAGKLNDPAAIKALVRAWEDYNRAVEQAARRTELVLDARQARKAFDQAKGMEARTRALEDLNRANQALREFDADAAMDRQRAVAEARIDLLEAEERKREEVARAAAEAANLQREIEDNQYQHGAMTTEQYLALLDQRIAAEQQYTNEWSTLVQRRERILQEAADKAEEDYRRIVDAAREAMREAEDVRSDAMSRLENLLDREADLRAQQAENEQRYAERMADLQDRQRAAQARHEKARQQVLAQAAEAEQRLVEARQKVHDQAADAEDRYLAEREQAAANHTLEMQQLVTARRDTLLNALRADTRLVEAWGNDVNALTGNVGSQAAALEEWAALLVDARARGVSEAVVGALGLDEGPQAIGQLRQFTNATAAEIDALNQAVAARTAAAAAVADSERDRNLGRLGQDLAAAQQRYAEQQQAAADAYAAEQARFGEELTALSATFAAEQARFTGELQVLNDTLLAEQQQTAAEMAVLQAEFIAEQAALADQLANLGLETGRSFGDAIAEGLNSSLPGVRAAAQALIDALAKVAAAEAALANAESRPAAPATGTSGGRSGGAPGKRSRQVERAHDARFPGATADNPLALADPTAKPGTLMYGVPLRAYDVGGWLQPGYTLAYNGTGRPERVVGPGQGRGAGGGGDTHVRVFIGDRELTDIVDVRIDTTLGSRRTSSQIAGSR